MDNPEENRRHSDGYLKLPGDDYDEGNRRHSDGYLKLPGDDDDEGSRRHSDGYLKLPDDDEGNRKHSNGYLKLPDDDEGNKRHSNGYLNIPDDEGNGKDGEGYLKIPDGEGNGRDCKGYLKIPNDDGDDDVDGKGESKSRIINPGIMKIMEEPKERRTRLIKQGMKMFLVSFGMWSMGSTVTFPSVVASDLSDHNTTIFGSIISFTDSQMDMIGSLTTLFSLPGVWVMAVLMGLWGRRFAMIISGILVVFGWLGVILLPGHIGIMAARCVSGIAVGCLSVSMNAYAIEMPDPDVRGALFVIVNNGVLAGQVVTMACGTFARYFAVALIDLVLPLIFIITVIWLPESPSFLVVKGHIEAARRVLSRLRGPAADVEAEINFYEEKNNFRRSHNDGGMRWRELLKPDILQSFFTVSSLFIILHFTGYTAVSANASRIFKAAGSTVNDSIAAVIVTVVKLCAGIVSSFLIDRIGRRRSLFLSYSLMCISMTILAVYISLVDNDDGDHGDISKENHQLQEAYGWIPLVCLMVSQAAVVIGAYPVPYIVTNEYFPTTLRSQASSICYTIGTLASFAVLQLYSPMLKGLTQTGLYAFYASLCAIGIPFTYFFVRETAGQQVG